MCKKNAPNHICVKFGALSTESLIVSVFGGGKEIRTPDPLLARQVLSQLSYTPINPASTYSPIPSPV